MNTPSANALPGVCTAAATAPQAQALPDSALVIFSADCPIDYCALGIMVPPETRLVVPRGIAQALTAAAWQAGAGVRVSGMGHYTRPYYAHDLAGKSVLVWRGGGIGDRLVLGGALLALRELFPTADIAMFNSPSSRSLFDGADNLPYRVVYEPLTLAEWDRYDYHLVLTDLVESDREPDQPDMWTSYVRRIGLDRLLTPGVLAGWRGYVVAPSSMRSRHAAYDFWRPRPGRPRLLWQLAASTALRSYAPARTVEALTALREAFPESYLGVFPSRFLANQYAAVRTLAGVEWLTTGIQTSFELIRQCDCLVCPDSCLGHAAAATDVPVVSLWGSFAPALRVADYPNHLPLTGKRECAPCLRHEDGHGRGGCPRAEAQPPGWCEALAGIEPAAIVARVRQGLAERASVQ
jgi:hypothetical protein